MKKIAIFLVIAILILASAYFFSVRNNTGVVIQGSSVVVGDGGGGGSGGSVSQDTEQETFPVPLQKKEFTEFGNFWIEIDKGDDLKIKAPILGSVDKQALKRGVGHHTSTALPNPESGNIVLSGHRWLPGSNPANTVFRHLDKLSVGDDITIMYEGKEYLYRVRESKTVSDDAVEILDQTDKPQLTLYTCTPIFTALKRLVYVADLIDVR